MPKRIWMSSKKFRKVHERGGTFDACASPGEEADWNSGSPSWTGKRTARLLPGHAASTYPVRPGSRGTRLIPGTTISRFDKLKALSLSRGASPERLGGFPAKKV
jgi:hypothetical protein